MEEVVGIHGMRPTVNLHDCRVFLAFFLVCRWKYPTLDFPAIWRGSDDIYGISDRDACQHFVVRMANLNLVARQFIGEYEAFQDSFTYPRQWNSETNTQVSNMTSIYLSLQTDHYSYTGGAHGMYWTMFTHYWLPENKELHLGDLVDSTQMQDLLTMAEAQFWAQEAQNGEEMSPDFYFFEDEQFYLPDNLNFERDSLLFLYNIYEIKPYVFGTTELRIPYTDIQPFLSEKAKAIIIELNK